MSVNSTVVSTRSRVGALAHTGHELLDLVEDRLRIPDPWQGVVARQLDECGVGQPIREEPRALDPPVSVRPPQDERRHADRGQQRSHVDVVEHRLVLVPSLGGPRERRQRLRDGDATPGRRSMRDSTSRVHTSAQCRRFVTRRITPRLDSTSSSDDSHGSSSDRRQLGEASAQDQSLRTDPDA